jgi:hypothetical protein
MSTPRSNNRLIRNHATTDLHFGIMTPSKFLRFLFARKRVVLVVLLLIVRRWIPFRHHTFATSRVRSRHYQAPAGARHAA